MEMNMREVRATRARLWEIADELGLIQGQTMPMDVMIFAGGEAREYRIDSLMTIDAVMRRLGVTDAQMRKLEAEDGVQA